MGQLIGDEQTVHFLQPVTVKGPNGEALDLGYRTTTTWFLLGVAVRPQGYVLVPQGDYRHYFSLSPDEVKQYQAQGGLPNPLPPYQLSFSDYLTGYSLWIAILIALIFPVRNYFVERKRRAAGLPGTNDAHRHSSPA